jgi:hypothetical protein
MVILAFCHWVSLVNRSMVLCHVMTAILQHKIVNDHSIKADTRSLIGLIGGADQTRTSTPITSNFSSESDALAITHSRSIFGPEDRRECRSSEIAVGHDRAFSVCHKRRRDTVARLATREWESHERLRKWNDRRTVQVLSWPKGGRDTGILEDIARQRDSTNSEPRSLAASTVQLPKMTKLVMYLAKRVFLWGS